MKLVELIKKLAVKHREIIFYGIFGMMTTVVNWTTYTLIVNLLSLTVSNIIAWTVAVIFAFFVNKLYVFRSKSMEPKLVFREAATFLSGRLASGVIEMGGPPILVWLGLDQEFFGIEGSVAKAIISVFVIIMNFIYSKLVVFRRAK